MFNAHSVLLLEQFLQVGFADMEFIALKMDDKL
jgi:hypothetical protein